MWKWIVGAALLLVVVLGGTCYLRVKKFASGGAVAAVSIAGTPDHVFASLADPDSMQAWMGEGTIVTAPHRGLMAVGDTIRVETGVGLRGHQQFGWVVTDVTPGQLLVRQMPPDSMGAVLAVRRDSLAASGDSTHVTSTIASPMMESVKSVRGDTIGKVGGALLDFSTKMIISTFRELTRLELIKLKSHVEAKRG